MDDWWDVDDAAGFIRGQRTGKRIGIGDVVKTIVVRVDVARRELGLSITQILGRGGVAQPAPQGQPNPPPAQRGGKRGGSSRPQPQGKQRPGKQHHAPPKSPAKQPDRGGGPRNQGGGGGGGGGAGGGGGRRRRGGRREGDSRESASLQN